MYYDHSGNFCGVENGVDFQDSVAFLKMKWWETQTFSCANADSGLGGSYCFHPQRFPQQ